MQDTHIFYDERERRPEGANAVGSKRVVCIDIPFPVIHTSRYDYNYYDIPQEMAVTYILELEEDKEEEREGAFLGEGVWRLLRRPDGGIAGGLAVNDPANPNFQAEVIRNAQNALAFYVAQDHEVDEVTERQRRESLAAFMDEEEENDEQTAGTIPG